MLLVRGDEYLVLDLSQSPGKVNTGPLPLSAAFGGAFLAALQGQGGAADAVLFGESVTGSAPPWVFQGPAVAGFDRSNAGSTLQWRRYVAPHFGPSWPAAWNPALQQAPSGRVGALWAATTAGAILHHDGAGWTVTAGSAHSVAAGADGSAYCIGVDLAQHNLYRWSPDKSDWDTVLQHAGTLSQVAVGDASRVWVRDDGNAVHQLQGGQLAPVPQLGTAVHVAANGDGTVWSCDGSRTDIFRFISEATSPPEAITVGAAAPVSKIASTGFGAAHCLVGQGEGAQLYRYDSPYVFKTSPSYIPATSDPIASGLGNLYLAIEVWIGEITRGIGRFEFFVVALDAHTGREVSRSAAAPEGLRYVGPVFDPLQEAVYVAVTLEPGATAPDAPSQLLALDARDLTRVRWTVSLPSALDSGFTLAGTQLCLADRAGRICLFDTQVVPGTTPAPTWVAPGRAVPAGLFQFIYRPAIADGVAYAPLWFPVLTGNFITWELLLATCSAADGSGLKYLGVEMAGQPVGRVHPVSLNNLSQFPPLLGQAIPPGGSQDAPALFVNGGDQVLSLILTDAFRGSNSSVPATAYTLTVTNTKISSGFAYGAGGLWFGDDQGNLYGLDEKLQPLPHTPAQLDSSGHNVAQIRTTPVVYQGDQGATGQTAVFVGAYSSNRPPSLLTFDPSSGNILATPTGLTWPTTLSPSATDGVLYAAGVYAGGGAGGEANQVFGIRVDEAVQGLRDFVVESQLLQDFDPAPAGQSNPANTSGAARYQTHLTLLDDSRAPQPLTPVKIWADAPTTIQVNGSAYAVGPGDADFAAAQAGPDGVVTIVSGAVAIPGQGAAVSAPADVAAVPLRVWAPFIDPYERLVVFPDREFHNRLATAHATTNQNDPAYSDPTKINLQSVRSYGQLQSGGAPAGAPLFTDDERQQQQPQQVTQAIQTMTRATGGAPSGGATAAATTGRMALRGRAAAGAAWVRRVTDTPGKYLAYEDLPGARYAPANTPSPRAAVAVQPAGLSFSRDDAGATPPALGQLTPAAAAAAIDALQGTPWEQSPYAPASIREAAQAGAVRGQAGAVRGAGLGSWWTDFWQWLKSVAAKITHFIVSVAEDIYVGIRLIVDGVVHVFKQIVHVLEEVAHAIGAFFVELGKAIEKVVEALALVFEFGEVIKTHAIIKTELLNRINGVSGNAAYPGFTAVVTNTVRAKVDGVFDDAEKGANGALNALADKLSGNAPVGGITGGGSTAHSALTVGPGVGPGRASSPPKDGSAASQAVQGTWALQKLKSGVGGAGGGSGARSGVGAAANPLTAFFDTFAASIQGNGTLQSQWQVARDGFTALGSSSGAGDFLKRALAELLRLVALLVDAALAVAKAFVDGILAEIATLLTLLFDPRTGLLTTEVEIPVLSWLYRALFGEPLTVVNAIALVVALPVTLIWRIVKGQWPSQSIGGASTAGGVGAAPAAIRSLINYANIVLTLSLGFIYAVGDIRGGELATPTLGKVALALSLFVSACSLPLVNSTTPPSDSDWIAWGLAFSAAALNILGAIELAAGGPAEQVLKYLGPVLLGVLSAGQLAIFVLQFVKTPPPDPMGDAILGLSIATTVPGIVNVFKLAPPFPVPATVVALLDVAMGLVGAVIIGLEDSQ